MVRMPVHRSIQSGFTLIELMVGLAITALLLATAVPLSTGWVNSADVTQTKAALQKAFSQTKSIALENPDKVTGDSAAAFMCVSGNTVRVQTIDHGTCGSGDVWKAGINSSVTLSVNSAAFNCIGLNNVGLPVPLTLAAGTVCTQSKVITVTKGAASDARTLY